MKGSTAMKSFYKGILAFSILLLASAGKLFAQPYSFDENGNGLTYAGTDNGFPLPYQVAPDPTGGITTSSVLIYSLEAPVISGDLELLAPGGSSVDALLRFFTPVGASTSDMIFYAPVNGTLAGVGLPSSTDPLEITETGSQTFFRPNNIGQPGGGVGTFPVFDVFQYTIITATPEPSTTALLLVASGIWLTVWGSRWKGRKASA
jgi:hypothetical protein